MAADPPQDGGVTPADPSARSPSVLNAEPLPHDHRWMSFALEEARAARAIGEVPVGAIVVLDEQIIAAAHNLTRTTRDPSAHAEMLAIRAAAEHLGDWRLLNCTLYVTLEPCTMCSGAIVLTRLPRLVYGTPDLKAGMAGSLANLVQDSRLNHRVALTTGVRADESAGMLREFFTERRREGFPAKRRGQRTSGRVDEISRASHGDADEEGGE